MEPLVIFALCVLVGNAGIFLYLTGVSTGMMRRKNQLRIYQNKNYIHGSTHYKEIMQKKGDELSFLFFKIVLSAGILLWKRKARIELLLRAHAFYRAKAVYHMIDHIEWILN